jgi:hypothetical protein
MLGPYSLQEAVMMHVNRDIAINVGLFIFGIGLVAAMAAHAPIAPRGLRQAVELMTKRAASEDLLRAAQTASADDARCDRRRHSRPLCDPDQIDISPSPVNPTS